MNIHDRRSDDLSCLFLNNIGKASTSKESASQESAHETSTVHLQTDQLDATKQLGDGATDTEELVVETLEELEVPVFNMDASFQKLIETIKAEFAKTAAMITNVLNRGGGNVIPLLPMLPQPADGGVQVNADNVVSEELNTPISIEAGVAKLDSDLKMPDIVQRYVSYATLILHLFMTWHRIF